MKEIYKKIELENELKRLIEEGKTREEAVSIAIEKYGMENANYLIEAYLMPIDEITKEIEKYDSSKPKLDEIKFVNELCERYNVDRKALVERIQNVRRINKQKSLETPERLEQLKNRRDSLQREKDKLSDKSMDIEEKSMFYFGLGIVTVVGGLLFYPASPILVGLIPVAYAVGVPSVRMSALMKKEYGLVNELVDLDKEINILDTKLNGQNENVKSDVEELASITDNMGEYVDLALNNSHPSYDIDVLMSVFDEEAKDENSIQGPTLVKRGHKKQR